MRSLSTGRLPGRREIHDLAYEDNLEPVEEPAETGQVPAGA